MQIRVAGSGGAPGGQASDHAHVQHRREHDPNAQMRTTQWLKHCRTAFTHRSVSSGHNAAAPGATISRKPSGACRATGSTRAIPTLTNAIANATPAAP